MRVLVSLTCLHEIHLIQLLLTLKMQQTQYDWCVRPATSLKLAATSWASCSIKWSGFSVERLNIVLIYFLSIYIIVAISGAFIVSYNSLVITREDDFLWLLACAIRYYLLFCLVLGFIA